MKLRISHTLLVALEHALGDSPALLHELRDASASRLRDSDGLHSLTLGDDLVQRIHVAVDGLQKREWLQPFFGPLTGKELRQHWHAAVISARAAVQAGDN